MRHLHGNLRAVFRVLHSTLYVGNGFLRQGQTYSYKAMFMGRALNVPMAIGLGVARNIAWLCAARDGSWKEKSKANKAKEGNQRESLSGPLICKTYADR
jgi:hypothetical protein